MRGHSVGGYGSVTTNKVIATIAGEVFGMDVQAYPKYGSEKKGLPTTYYLTIAKDHIRVHSELEHVEFIPLNDVNAFNLENPLAGLSDNGMVFVQSPKTDTREIWAAVPAWARRNLIQKNVRVFALDTVKIAKEVSSLADLQQRMQGIVLLGVFLRRRSVARDRRRSPDHRLRPQLTAASRHDRDPRLAQSGRVATQAGSERAPPRARSRRAADVDLFRRVRPGGHRSS